MIELYGVFYKLITTNYYNCLCCQLPYKSVFQAVYYTLYLSCLNHNVHKNFKKVIGIKHLTYKMKKIILTLVTFA